MKMRNLPLRMIGCSLLLITAISTITMSSTMVYGDDSGAIKENEVTRAPISFDGYHYNYRSYSELIEEKEITRAAITFDGVNYIEEDLEDLLGLLVNFHDVGMELYTSSNKPEVEFQPMILIESGDKQYKISPYGRIAYGTYGNSFVYYDTIGHANALYHYGEDHISKYLDKPISPDFTPSGEMLDCLELPQSSWAVDEVASAANENILPYELSCNYGENINRREFCQLAAQALGIKESELENPDMIANSIECLHSLDNILERYSIEKKTTDAIFFDYPNTPNYMSFMCNANIISGRGDGIFAPEDKITREEMAKIMASIYSLFNQTEYTKKADYSDVSSVSDWALPYVALCQEYSIMDGMGDGRFAPKDFCTREQAIACVCRLVNRIYK